MEGSTAKTTTPQIAMKTELSYSTTLTGDRIKIGYVQKIGQLKALKDGQTYSALDLEEERMAKGKRKAEAVDSGYFKNKYISVSASAIPVIVLCVSCINIVSISTASVAGKPLVQTVKCTIDIAGQEVNDGDFIKDTMRVFKNSKVVETDGYPIEGDATKFED